MAGLEMGDINRENLKAIYIERNRSGERKEK